MAKIINEVITTDIPISYKFWSNIQETGRKLKKKIRNSLTGIEVKMYYKEQISLVEILNRFHKFRNSQEKQLQRTSHYTNHHGTTNKILKHTIHNSSHRLSFISDYALHL